jgi:hypothetical protein
VQKWRLFVLISVRPQPLSSIPIIAYLPNYGSILHLIRNIPTQFGEEWSNSDNSFSKFQMAAADILDFTQCAFVTSQLPSYILLNMRFLHDTSWSH